MRSRFILRTLPFALAALMAACGNDSVSPSSIKPSKLEATGLLSRAAAVGSSIPNALSVKVSDATGKPVANVAVAFAVTSGNGATSPRVALTNANGEATATWTLGTIIGSNQVTASVMGVDTQVKFAATGTAGPVTAIQLSTQNARLLVNVDTVRITAQSLDGFGNATAPTPIFTVRDSSLISIDPSGLVRVRRRGAGTYVVAAADGKSDSVLVTVLAVGQSICTAVAAPVVLGVGQVITDVSGQGFCVRGASAGAEYAIIPFYAASIPSATIQLEIRGQGLTPLTVPTTSIFAAAPSTQIAEPRLVPNDDYERALRERERIGSLGLRGTGTSAAPAPALRALAASAIPAVGEIVKYNVNDKDFCDNADVRTGRVVAITDKAIVVADTANPAGGFTTAEYQAFGVTFDTLIDPIDRAAFGGPSDIDNNGRVVVFFTRKVNELTDAGSGGIVLGYVYRRDLYPKTGEVTCPGSNVAEIMYILVPDPDGVVNQNKRTKSQVITAANGTIAHEYQHIINASRRKYVNKVGENYEERWLDEGLAHAAEELNFWKASGRAPRSNLDAQIFSDPKTSAAYSAFVDNNFQRYKTYIQRPELQTPIGFDPDDADLQTRGAIWSFLRYVADRQPAGSENAFWFKLVNTSASGITNLASAFGTTPSGYLRDWSISLFMDDNAPNVDARFQFPSWNLRSALSVGGAAFPLGSRLLADNTTSQVLLAGNGVAFLRFSVANNQEALLTVTSGNQPIPSTVQLAVVRVR
jgi:hypothetical protein